METAALPRPTLELVVLGTGAGHSHVYDGRPNASYALVVDARPVLLIGAGGGVVHQCRRLLGTLPRSVFVHSNRTAAAAELPVLLSYEAAQGRKMTVVGGVGVIQRLAAHRLAEVHDVMRAKGQTFDDLCSLEPLDEGEAGLPLPDCPDVSLAVRAAPQSELSYALLVLYRGQPLLAVSGDAGIDGGGGEHAPRFYGDLSYAPTVVLDGRPVGTPDHAPVAGILDAFRAALVPNARARGQQRLHVLVGGHDVVAADQAGLHRGLGIPAEVHEALADAGGAEATGFAVVGAREGAVVALVPMSDLGSPVRADAGRHRSDDSQGAAAPASSEQAFESPTQRRVRAALGETATGLPPAAPSSAQQQQQQQQPMRAAQVAPPAPGPLSPGTFASRQWQQQHAFDDDDADEGSAQDAVAGVEVRRPVSAARPAAPLRDVGRGRGAGPGVHRDHDDPSLTGVHDFGVAASGRGPGNAARPAKGAAPPSATVAFGSSTQRPVSAAAERPSPPRARPRPTTPGRTRSPAPTVSIPAAKKLWLFSNENRHEAPVPVMAQHLRTLKQLHERVATALDGVKPVEGVYTLRAGAKVTRLDQLHHMDAVVVCKIGGERWGGLPPGGRGLPDTMREWLRDHGATDIIQVPAESASSRHPSPAPHGYRGASAASSDTTDTRRTSAGQRQSLRNTTTASDVAPTNRRKLL